MCPRGIDAKRMNTVKIFVLSLFSLMTLNAQALLLPQSKEEFCTRFEDRPEARDLLQTYSTESVNLMAFKNDGGLFNGGVCWWHSRFQRNIFYLSVFRPDLEKPKTLSQLKALIRSIRLAQSVLIIPGYHNFEEFSRENQKLIQAELNDWQLYDGVVLGGWMDGLKGDTKIAAPVLESMMKDVYQYVSLSKKIAYQKLQIKGITSHAWLVVGMKKTESGFEIGYLDSNSPRMSLNYTYKSGDTSFFIKGYGDFVPYLEFKREEERLTSVARKFCGLKSVGLAPSLSPKAYQRDLEEAKMAGRPRSLKIN